MTTDDQANGVKVVLDHLGIDSLHAWVGASYGGMVGLAFGALHSDRLERLLMFCAAHRSHPMATGLRGLQRRIVELATAAGREPEGLALARELAMTTYRTPEEFEKRFVSVPIWEEGSPHFAVEKYLKVQGEKFVRRFDGRACAILSQSLDLHNVDPALVRVPTTVVSVDSDTLVPPWLVGGDGAPVTRHGADHPCLVQFRARRVLERKNRGWKGDSPRSCRGGPRLKG